MNIQHHYSPTDFAKIHDFLSNTAYWSQGISEQLLAKALANSLCFIVKSDAGELLGFARVVSDYATFANLLDVFVVPEYRAAGVGKFLLTQLFSHPELQGLRRFTLATKDAHGLYAKFGFTQPLYPEGNMEVYRPNMYLVPA